MKIIRRIATLSEQFLWGGLETQIYDQSIFLKQRGIQNFLITTGKFAPSNLCNNFSDICNIQTDFSIKYYALKQALVLRDYIKEQKIDFLHIHPYYSILPGIIAALLARTPFAITLHGPDSVNCLDSYSRILLEKQHLFCVSQETADMAAAWGIGHRTIIPNPVSPGPNRKAVRTAQSGLTLLFVSRLDYPKTRGFISFLHDLANSAFARDIRHIDVAGDGDAQEQIQEFIDGHSADFTVRVLGKVDEPRHIMRNYDLVLGMGRVILEAIAEGVEALCIGYDGLKGYVTPELLHKLAYANFSGRGLPTVICNSLLPFMAQNANEVISANSSWIRNNCSSAYIWNFYLKTIETIKPQSIFDFNVYKALYLYFMNK